MLEAFVGKQLVRVCFSGAGLLADGNYCGPPAGVVLGLIGLSSMTGGSFIVWYAIRISSDGIALCLSQHLH